MGKQFLPGKRIGAKGLCAELLLNLGANIAYLLRGALR